MAQYRLVPGSIACDICVGMQGVYPSEPHVPIHKNCDCTVEEVDDDEGEDGEEEIRDIKIERSTFSDTRQIAEGTVASPLPADEDASFVLPLGEEVSAWDHEKLEEEADWHPESGGQEILVTLRKGGYGTFQVFAEVEMEEVMAQGELWEVTRRPAAGEGPDSYAHTVEERHIGTVVGYGVASTGVSSAYIEIDVEGGSGQDLDDYFEDGDEVPA
jgi:hypothetical protein